MENNESENRSATQGKPAPNRSRGSVNNEELRRVQLELARARDRFFELFALAPIAYLTVRRDGTIAEANVAATELFDVELHDLVGARLHGLVDAVDAERLTTLWERVFGTPQRCGDEFRLVAGRTVRIEADAPAKDDAALAMTTIVDLTPIRRAERTAEASQDRFRALFETAALGTLIVTPDGGIVLSNHAARRLLRLDREELERRTIFDIAPPDDHDAIAAELRLARSQPGYRIDASQRYLRGHEEEFWAHTSATLVFDAEDRPLYGAWLLRDITDEREAGEALIRAEARYKAIVETADEGIVTIDEAGFMTSVNPAAEQMFGYPAHEAVGQNVTLLMPSPHREHHDTYIADYLRTGDAKIIGIGREVDGRRKDGTEFPVHLSVADVHADGQRLFVGFIRDLTDAKAMQRQLVHSQKMEAVGRLASGVAHDFNNLLMGVSGCATMALRVLPEDSPARKYLDEIRKASAGGANITRQLLDFSRTGEVAAGVVELGAVIASDRQLLQRTLGEDVLLIVRLEAASSRVPLARAQVEQVLFNLCINARDAMPHGGRLTIETAPAIVPVGARRPDGLAPGEYVALTVTDTGGGMPEEVRQRIFEPFFTTKRVGKGTGLGLSTMHGIVKSVGGGIEVRSREGHGTTFEVWLPLTTKPITQEVEAIDAPNEPAQHTSTVLLVEDERAVRMTARHYLEHGGYRVLEAETGSRAIELFRDAKDDVDLVLTDMVLPSVSGSDLARQISELKPGIKILYMSAHDSRWLWDHGRLPRGVEPLLKPFSERTLLERARAELQTPPAEDGEARRGTVLVVDDEEASRLGVGDFLEDEGWTVLTVADAQAARAACRERHGAIDILLTDYELGTSLGDDLARELTALYPQLQVAYMSGHCDLEPNPAGPVLTKPLDLDDLSRMLEPLLPD